MSTGLFRNAYAMFKSRFPLNCMNLLISPGFAAAVVVVVVVVCCCCCCLKG